MSQNLQLAITAFGGPETLKLQHSSIPTPSENLVLVKVAFAGVNPIDAKTRAGLGWGAEKIKDSLPWVPGFDAAGTVVSDGAAFNAGERVVGRIVEGGGYGQYLLADASALTRIPDAVSFQQAACLPVAGLTALQALELANVKAGDRVLILAGAGGVGHIAIQLAKAKGATVFTSVSSTNTAFVSSLGATALDYNESALERQVRDVDVLIDLMGGDVGEAALACIKSGGRVVTVPTITAPRIIEAAEANSISAQGMLVQPNAVQLDVLLAAIEAKTLLIEITKTYPLEQGVQAHVDIQTGRTRGKILLEMPE
ncbi:NADP-dependent oxidoreductase [Enterovibrio nigricans]|uniref:NADPH2:quinone reductase n=1 Tax=Enterovibrio nigricans DSM 22720 TaxID=1121868 RepID=A0A1T4TZH8_9GAMM|nr:NADP-dependent oxidoreductase [Enterovibrio nigricans]PKF51689.1 NADP-dependent oxidoreductase [Enterovibrio nigricans]SKA45844.1 NADPH2:quinone reductase [Enterovibrio nigricans DSM 22720]